MKGPGIRYDVDIRRLWECPICGNQIRHLGNVTARRCSCENGKNWMTLIEEDRHRVFPEREKIVIPEDEPEEAEPELQEEAEAVEEASVSLIEAPAEETTDIEETPPQDRKKNNKKRKKKKKPQQKHNAGEQGHAPEPKASTPESPASDSSAEDDVFGENIFDE